MAGQNNNNASGGRSRMNMSGMDTERWVAIITLLALAILILIRMGFRGIGFGGANVSLS